MSAAAPVATNDHELAESYGTQALRLWAQGGTVHSRSCPDLLCADGRKLAGLPPLVTEIERVTRRGGG